MKNTTPQHRRASSREFQTALTITEALRKAGCFLPTPPLHKLPMPLVDMIAVGMGTVKAEDLPPAPVVTAADQEFFDSLNES